MKTPKGPKYKGVLAQPMSWRQPGLVPSPEDVHKHNLLQLLERFVALHDFYGIDLKEKGADTQLVLALAHNHVPGFRINTRSPGRPAKWKGSSGLKLYTDVLMLKREGHTVLEACQILAGQSEYTGMKPQTIRRLYQEIPNKIEGLKAIIEAYEAGQIGPREDGGNKDPGDAVETVD